MVARPESPAAPRIDEVLRAAASRSSEPVLDGAGRVVTTDTVWFCACETFDEWESWVVHTVGDDGIGWVRSSDGREPGDVVVADRLVGHHPAPESVLRWLTGDEPDPWARPDDDPATAGVVAELHRRIHLQLSRTA